MTARERLMCVCGHPQPAHQHYRRGSDCGFSGCGCDRYQAAAVSDRVDGPELVTLYLTLDEIDAIAVHLARAVDPTRVAGDAQAASWIIWAAPDATLTLKSLATMFAELRVQLIRRAR